MKETQAQPFVATRLMTDQDLMLGLLNEREKRANQHLLLEYKSAEWDVNQGAIDAYTCAINEVSLTEDMTRLGLWATKKRDGARMSAEKTSSYRKHMKYLGKALVYNEMLIKVKIIIGSNERFKTNNL